MLRQAGVNPPHTQQVLQQETSIMHCTCLAAGGFEQRFSTFESCCIESVSHIISACAMSGDTFVLADDILCR